MKTISIFSIALLACTYACNTGENPENKTAEKQNEAKFNSTNVEKDVDFAMEAASRGMMEVDAGNLAIASASSPRVKDYGQTMVNDHTKANDELRSAAKGKNITLPTVPANRYQKDLDDLKKKSGADFDKAYIDLTIDNHKQ